MLMRFLTEANLNFKELQSEYRFDEDISGGDDVYAIYMGKKKTGKPKDDYPSKSLHSINSDAVYCRLGIGLEGERL